MVSSALARAADDIARNGSRIIYAGAGKRVEYDGLVAKEIDHGAPIVEGETRQQRRARAREEAKAQSIQAKRDRTNRW